MKIFNILQRRFLSCLTHFNSLVAHVLGDFSWRPPSWLRRCLDCNRLVVYVFVLVVVAAWLSFHWYKGRPRPHTVSMMVKVPGVTPREEVLHPESLAIEFSESAAPLDRVGKVMSAGINMVPATAGEWRWESDSRLVFKPVNDWPAGTEYTIRFDRDFFPDHVRLESHEVQFQSVEFQSSIQELEFYVDPTNPAVKQVVATLDFTHPVNATDLERRISMKMMGDEKVFPPGQGGRLFAVTYDTHHRQAYVRSVSLTLPRKQGFMKMMVAKGVRPEQGEGKSASVMEKEVLVPDVYSLMGVKSLEFAIVRNEDDEAEQVLVVTTSTAVSSKEIVKNLSLYALPKDKPALEKEPLVENYEWLSPREVTEQVLGLSKAIPLTLIPGDLETGTLHSFRFVTDDATHLYAKLKKGVEAQGGFVMQEDFDTVAHAPALPQEIKIMHEGSVLALSGERKLSVLSRGVPAIEFQLGRVIASQINHLVSQSGGNFQNPCFRNYNFNEENISELLTDRQTIHAEGSRRTAYTALDFSKFMTAKGEVEPGKGPTKHGLFFVHAVGWNPVDEKYLDVEDHRFILVTDLGFLVKDCAGGTHDVFVQSIRSGLPVEGARVEVIGKNGVVLLGAVTTADGHVSFPDMKDFTRDRQPVAWLIRKGDDLSFMPFERRDRQLNFSRFDIGGIAPEAPDTLNGFVFSERGIYRPGETVHVGLMVKRQNWLGGLAGIPMEIEVTDPRGLTVQTNRVALNESGFLEWSYRTGEASLTGQYRVNMYLVTKNVRDVLLGSTTVRVEEFLPDRMKIKTTLSEERSEGWVSPKDLKGLVNLQNLYGSTAEGHRVTARLRLTHGTFNFSKYPEHTFHDPLWDHVQRDISHEEDLPEQKADANGNAVFDFNLDRFESLTFLLAFNAQGFELEGGRCVSGASGVMVSPLDHLLGYKSDGDLNYIKLDGKRSVELLAVNAQVQPVAVSGLELRVIEERYVSMLTRKENGNYAYESTLKEIEVSREPVALTEKGLMWSVPSKDPGDFVARVMNAQGACILEIPFTVVGQRNLSRSLEKNTELNVKIPGGEFRAGEEIAINITAPYTGAGLITIERDRVYAQKWFKAETTASVQTITVPKNLDGNAYLNIVFIRAPDSKEIYMSPLSCSVVPFRISREKRTVHVDLDIPAQARPGETMEIGFKTDHPSKIVVYAVDEGILQVAHYSLPDPLDHFLRKVALQVETSQIMDLILPEYSIAKKVAATGGDGSDAMLARNLNPFKRKTDPPVVFWSGIVDAGPVMKKLVYPVPDYFSGTLRVMAVAVSEDAVGAVEKKSRVRGSFVINPNVPTFVAPGDVFDVSVALANTMDGSGANVPVSVEIKASDGLEIVKRPDQPILISEGKEISFHCQVKAKDILGNADLVFTATHGSQRSSLASHLSIRPPVAYVTSVKSGYFNGGHSDVEVGRTVYTEFRKAAACVSPAPLGFSRGLNAYLQDYSYGCTEQLVSKAFPSLVLNDQLEFGLTRVQAEDHLKTIIGILRSRQGSDGAFGYWRPGDAAAMDFPSVYAMHYLTEAKQAGFAVPPDLVKRGLGHLEQMAVREVGGLYEARIQAYAIYLLTRNDVVTTNYLIHLREYLDNNFRDEWQNDLAGVYVAAAYALLKKDGEAEKLIKAYRMQDRKDVRWDFPWYTRLGENSQYVDVLAKHFPHRLRKLSSDDLLELVKPVEDEEFNTLSAAYAIVALTAYTKAVDIGQFKDLGIAEVMADGKSQQLALPAGNLPSVGFSAESKQLRFSGKNTGNGLKGLFYQVAQSGFDRTLPTKIVKDGIEVQREYRDKKNVVVDNAELGAELTVHLKVRSLNQESVSHVAVVDMLPGGFEVVPESIIRNGGAMSWADYVDVREDRVVFFGLFDPSMREFVYRIRATNQGEYVVPPVFAESMYKRKVRSNGLAGRVTVTATKQ